MGLQPCVCWDDDQLAARTGGSHTVHGGGAFTVPVARVRLLQSPPRYGNTDRDRCYATPTPRKRSNDVVRRSFRFLTNKTPTAFFPSQQRLIVSVGSQN